MNAYRTGPYSVVRYPTYYVVIDNRTKHHEIVFESRSRDRAHAAASELNEKAHAEA